MSNLRLRYHRGVQLGAIHVDPVGHVDLAFWTHRPARRRPARQVLAAEALARGWRRTLGIPFGQSAVAGGLRIELVPTGYGPGGAALLATEQGVRTLIVGPCTEALLPRQAEVLVLFASRIVPAVDWVDGAEGRLVVPDGAAAHVAAAALTAAGKHYDGPRWLPGCTRGASVRVTTRGPGRLLDTRPIVRPGWRAEFVREVAPESVWVCGDDAARVSAELVAAGVHTRVLAAPRQLALLGGANPLASPHHPG